MMYGEFRFIDVGIKKRILEGQIRDNGTKKESRSSKVDEFVGASLRILRCKIYCK